MRVFLTVLVGIVAAHVGVYAIARPIPWFFDKVVDRFLVDGPWWHIYPFLAAWTAYMLWVAAWALACVVLTVWVGGAL